MSRCHGEANGRWRGGVGTGPIRGVLRASRAALRTQPDPGPKNEKEAPPRRGIIVSVAGIEALGPYWKSIRRGRHFRVQAVSREPRVAAITRVEDAVQRHGGDVLDFKVFSDVSLSLLVELTGPGAAALVDALAALGWPAEVDPPRDALAAAGAERLEGTVQVTFPEGAGALAHPQPAVPG